MINTNRFSREQYQYKTGHKGLFYLKMVIHADRPKLTLIRGGQSAKQYAPRVVRSQSTNTPLTAA